MKVLDYHTQRLIKGDSSGSARSPQYQIDLSMKQFLNIAFIVSK